MAVDIRLPHITGTTEKEQLKQIHLYLFQLAEKLQWALNNVDTSSNTVVVKEVTRSIPSSSAGANSRMVQDDYQAAFAALKPLIIKSAEIVDAYYEEINKKLEGLYVAQSDFGTFVEKTSQDIEVTSKNITQQFEDIQVVVTELDNNVGSIESSIHGIVEDLSYTQNDIIKLSVDIEDIDGSVASIEGEIGEIDANLKAVGDNVDSLDTNLKSVEGNVVQLGTNLQNAKTELSSSINNTKEELAGNINSAKETLTGNINEAKEELTGKVDAVDEDLQAAKTATNERIDDTNGSVASIGVGLNETNGRIAGVDEDLQNSKASLNNSIQGVQESLTGVNALLEESRVQIQGSLDDIEAYITSLRQVVIGVTAYLKSGLLYYTDAQIPVYGLEIGQTVKDELAGVEVFNKYARFTSEKLSFYDTNGNEVAYISDKKLFIRFAEITVSYKIGGLIDLVMANGDVVTKWVGG